MPYPIPAGGERPATFKELEQRWDENDRRREYQQRIAQGFSLAETYLAQRHLDYFSASDILEMEGAHINDLDVRIYRIGKVVFDPEEQVNDKLISVYGGLHDIQSAVAIIIRATADGVAFYAATRSKAGANANLAGETLRAALKGNFPGIDIAESLADEERNAFLNALSGGDCPPGSLATVSLIPSERDENKQLFVQGIEKFIGSMMGKTYTAVLLATPVDPAMLTMRRHGYESLYSQMSPHAKISMSFAHSETDSVNEGLSFSMSDSFNQSVSESNGNSTSGTKGVSQNDGSSFNWSTDGFSTGSSSSSGTSSSYTTGSSFSHTVSSSTGKNKTDTINQGKTTTLGDTDTTSLTFENKSVLDLMKRAESQLKRIDFSDAYGMWDFGAYFFSEDVTTTSQAVNLYKSLMLGHESSVERAHVNLWNGDREAIGKILRALRNLRHPIGVIPAFGEYTIQQVTPTQMVNGKELPMVLGLPRKSVPGLAVVEMAEFGRAVVYENPERVKRQMAFGSIYHMGAAEALRVPMDVDMLASHCLITGSSGSGKSYATYQLLGKLLESDVRMMVIEPAKGEYKQVFGGLSGLKIYNTDPNVYKMLRINPFQFPDNIHVLSHIEKLVQIFNASWALYAAMPAILKDAIVQSYTRCGWDVANSIWIEGISDHRYPVFADVLDILPKIINRSDYSADSKGDYKGALLTRVQSMTTGITQLIFERSEGVADSALFDSNVVIDLSDIGSEETVSLIMGVLIMRLGEYRQSVRKREGGAAHDLPLRHVTVLEEAHNILKRTSKEQSQEGANIVGKSVEMICNSVKEMRTYGEGFIIIDQSPMAIDTTAIENTSTKIIFNTPTKDACEEMGNALSLTEEQTRELSRLSTGVAAVFQKGWMTPVLMKVDLWDPTRYEAAVRRANLEDLRSLRGDLAREFYRQSETQAYSPQRMRSIIRQSNIDRDKMKDFVEIVDQMNELLLNNRSGLALEEQGRLLIALCNCEGLFPVLEDPRILSVREIRTMRKKGPERFGKKEEEALSNRCREWVRKFLGAIRQYACIDDEAVLMRILASMLIAKCGGEEAEGSAYYTILLWLTK